ncbi:MAG: TrkA family potassium uptake protein [Actinomycetota bacterium]|nr:TrkA family potassium uptake protein [Actinomycetota bacterium]
MYVIVVGCGRVGAQLAMMLADEGHDVVVIDRRSDSFKRLGSGFNGLTLVGNGFDQEALKRAGIDKADAFAAVTDLDNANIMAGQVAKYVFKVPRVVSRVYYPDREHTYHRLGLETVCGTTMVARFIHDKILGQYFVPHFSLGEDGAEIVEFPASKTIIGRKASEIELLGEFRLVSILRDKRVLIPTPDSKIEEEDTIIGVVKSAALEKIRESYDLKFD